MPAHHLRDQLQAMHDALADPGPLDEPTVASLRELATDIERLVPRQQEDAALEEPHSLRESVESMVLRFESQHPTNQRNAGANRQGPCRI